MILDLGPVLRGECKHLPVDYQLTLPPMEGVEFVEDLHVTGAVDDQGGYRTLSLQADVPYVAACARCLAPVRGMLKIDFRRAIAPESSMTQEQLEENFDEYVVTENGKLDVDRALSEEVLLSVPYRVLCSPDCRGLCPRCGKRLDSGLCHCPTEAEIDPRLAVLAQLLEDDPDEETPAT